MHIISSVKIISIRQRSSLSAVVTSFLLTNVDAVIDEPDTE